MGEAGARAGFAHVLALQPHELSDDSRVSHVDPMRLGSRDQALLKCQQLLLSRRV